MLIGHNQNIFYNKWGLDVLSILRIPTDERLIAWIANKNLIWYIYFTISDGFEIKITC